MRLLAHVSALLLLGCGAAPPSQPPEVATFSIVAFDPATGDLGIAVQSKVFGVGVVVPWVRADVGAVATQALANPAYGPDGLELLDEGASAEETVTRLIEADAGRDRRQVGVVDARGRAHAWTGKKTFAWSGHVVGKHYCCQGNILAGRDVVHGMAKAFEAAEGALAERLVAALRAGQVAGGDKRGRQSAALVVARRGGGYLGANDRYIDIRVDDHPRPIEELARLLVKRRGFGRDAPVPARPKGPLVREPARPVGGKAGARAVWLRWMRLWDEEDWTAVLAMANEDYRRDHTVQDVVKAHRHPKSPQRLARRGTYLGTHYVAGEERGGRQLAWLVFHVPRRAELVEVLLVREGDAWRLVP